MGGGDIKLNHQFVLSQLIKLYIINDAHILSGYTRKSSAKKGRRGPPPPGIGFWESRARNCAGTAFARAKLQPAAGFPAAGASSSFFRSAHTVFTGLSAGPLSKAGRRAQTHPWGTSAVPRTSTRRCAKIGGLPQTGRPLLYGGTAKNTPITRTDDGRALRLVQNHAGKCADAITCGGS